MATADLLAVYTELLKAGRTIGEVAVELICEHHEDWALLLGDDADIVSAKHLEREFGTYSTLKQVLDDGGVLHLFDRWVALKQSPTCRVMTTPSLSGDARQLEKACEHFAGQQGNLEFGEFEGILTKLAAEIVRRRTVKAKSADPKSEIVFVPESAETLAAFLRVLRFTHSRPFRDDLAYSAGDRYAMPVAVALGHAEAADAIWEALMNVVRERMRAAGPEPRAALPLVLGARDEPGFEKRMLTLADVETIVGVAVANPSGYRRLPKKVLTSKVAVKMSAGGCSDTAIARAESLRLQFRSHWRTVNSGPSKVTARRNVENALHRIADEEAAAVSGGPQPWGQRLWSAVQVRIDAFEGNAKAHGLDSNLLLGGVAELSNKCLVWFSPSFDADTVMRETAEKASS
ncbi:hypothetical protein [Nocardioides terrisoli]|uniref:hypothetical protein n=1 Tax=Nocardioides terrisoli TaxID=3388267 RepID=UPI00287B9D93|nr:hypothetical protein [Nocardioides marmorisolisilvae]